MTDPLPNDLLAEEAVLGRMMTRPSSISDIASQLTAGDFHQPLNGAMFLEMVNGYRAGEPLDSVALMVAMAGKVTAGTLAELVVHAPAGHERLVRELVGLRVRRDIIFAAADATAAARDLTADPLEALDTATAAMSAVDAPSENVKDLWYLNDFIDQPEESDPWVIPGMFRSGWRVIVVATEGRGKSWLSRQIAVAASAGIHPLFGSPIEPITTLIVDLENPVGSIADAGRKMRRQAQQQGSWDPARSFVWHRPGGIDLRKRADRAQLEGVIARCRPQFVSLGPLYKAYTTKVAEGHELPAGEVQTVLDDLRTRYGFALLLEHHAPKGQGGYRDILPYGSSLWLRWPEMGIKLTPSDRGSTTLDVGKWRADRMPNAWPDRISRGQGWPWVGEWDRSYNEAMEAVA